MVSPKQAILFIIVFLVLQQIEGNLIYPHVVGESGRTSINLGAGSSYNRRKSYGNYRYADFIPLVSVFYTIFREFVYLRLKNNI